SDGDRHPPFHAQRLDRRRPGGGLVLRLHRILKVENDQVGAALPGVHDRSRVASGKKQQRSQVEQAERRIRIPHADFPSNAGQATASCRQNWGRTMLEYFLIAVAVLVLLVVMMSVKIVSQGYRYTIERFGRFVRVAEPGLNLVTPFVYRVGRKINMMEQVVDIPGQEIITKDNAMVAVDGVVFFQVLDAAKAAYEVSDLYTALMALSITNLRTVMGSMDLAKTFSKRDEINARFLVVVDRETKAW